MSTMEITKICLYAIPCVYLLFISLTWSTNSWVNFTLKLLTFSGGCLGGCYVTKYILHGFENVDGMHLVVITLSSLIALLMFMASGKGIFAIIVRLLSMISIISSILLFTI